jgi:hypothetical protein
VCVPDGASVLDGGEEPGAGEEREMAVDDGEIDGAAGGDFGDGAGAAALDEAGEEREASGVCECFEDGRIEFAVNGRSSAGDLSRGGGFLGYLRHYASIDMIAGEVKRAW